MEKLLRTYKKKFKTILNLKIRIIKTFLNIHLIDVKILKFFSIIYFNYYIFFFPWKWIKNLE